MASITSTKTGFRAQIYLKGIRKSKTFTTKREATQWARKEEFEIDKDAKAQVEDRYTLRDALAKYRDEVSPENAGEHWEVLRINAFLNHPAWLPLDQKIGLVEPKDFESFCKERSKTVKDSTILREIGILSAIMESARKSWKWIKINPVHDAKKPIEADDRERLITRLEIKKLLREFDYHPTATRISSITQSISVTFLLALRTGMRSGDMTSLTWDDVHPRHILVKVDKNGRKKKKGRNVPLSKKAVRLVEKMRGFDKKSVFAVDPRTRDARFRDIREQAGLAIRLPDGSIDKDKTLTFHDSRHTAATWIAASFKSNKDITAQQAIFDMCKIFGWTDPKRALKYYNPNPNDMAARLDPIISA